jgi:hypothetical protein
VNGRVLTFHLAGINNQNFLMRDDETGSFWQQITGRAISGPLAGTALELASTDEVSFSVFRNEWPQGIVLAPEPRFVKQYATKDWDQRMSKARTVLSFPQTGIADRELMLGMTVGNAARAYPLKRVEEEHVVQDRVGETPVVLVVGPDGVSVRAFVSRVKGQDTQFFRAQQGAWSLVDSAGASTWDFRGCAISGPAQGTCLEPVGVVKDYWFDWRNYHSDTSVYRR